MKKGNVLRQVVQGVPWLSRMRELAGILGIGLFRGFPLSQEQPKPDRCSVQQVGWSSRRHQLYSRLDYRLHAIRRSKAGTNLIFHPAPVRWSISMH